MKEGKVRLLELTTEDAYSFLISKDTLESVADVINHCHPFEMFKASHITHKFGTLTMVTTVARAHMSSNNLRSCINHKTIAREELEQSCGHDKGTCQQCLFAVRFSVGQL